jgi:uncharacterized protein (DUF1015 family)
MNPQFDGCVIECLCVVGFADHQINIFDYNRFISLWVLKEGFTIPVDQKFVRSSCMNEFVMGVGEEGY